MKPPLLLKEYFFPFVQVSADPEFEETEVPPEIDFETKVVIQKDPDNNTYQVNLEITALPESEDKQIPYAIHLVVVGLFTVNEDWDNPEKLLRVNGASILYSAAREFIITVTSRGPWSPMKLPTISFMPPPDKEEKPEKKKKRLAKRVK